MNRFKLAVKKLYSRSCIVVGTCMHGNTGLGRREFAAPSISHLMMILMKAHRSRLSWRIRYLGESEVVSSVVRRSV